jgi:OOP family OmpA-OmpF porin
MPVTSNQAIAVRTQATRLPATGCASACLAIVATAWTLAAPSAHAAEPKLGPYVGAGGGVARYSSNLPSQIRSAYADTGFTVEDASITDDQDGAWKVYAGWRFHRYGAVEVGYLDLGEARSHYDIGVPGQGVAQRDGRYRLDGIEVSALAIMPFADRWSVFAKAGGLFTKLKYSESGTDQFGSPTSFSDTNNQSRFLWGLGGTVDFNDAISARLEWQRVEDVGKTFAFTDSGNGKFNHVDFISLNLQWRFR